MKNDEICKILVNQYGWSQDQIDAGIRAGFKCEYCSRDLLASVDDFDSWQCDHIIPTTKGGCNGLDNYAIACKTCNFIKRNWIFNENIKNAFNRSKYLDDIRQHILKERSIKQKRLDEMRKLINKLITS